MEGLGRTLNLPLGGYSAACMDQMMRQRRPDLNSGFALISLLRSYEDAKTRIGLKLCASKGW